jgi:hypothetical protein
MKGYHGPLEGSFQPLSWMKTRHFGLGDVITGRGLVASGGRSPGRKCEQGLMGNLLSRRVFVSSLGVAPLIGADFWQQKKFMEWSDKDVNRLLSDSPWCKPVSVALQSGGGGGGGGRGGGRGGRGGGGGMPTTVDASQGSAGGMGGGGRGGGGEGGEMGGGGEGGVTPTITVSVRWLTALPVKQANWRSRLGDAVETSAEAKASLEKKEESYIVGLLGLPARMATMEPDKFKEMLKSKTSLNRKGKDPLTPAAVDVRQQDQSLVILYQFAKKDPIVLDDKEVEFSSTIGALSFKKKFKLKDMVYNGDLAL